MMEEEVTRLIGTLGFPIAISIFLLVERSKTTKQLTKAITELTVLIRERLKR